MSSSDEVRVVAMVQARAGKEDALRAALLELVAPTHAEPGVLQYTLHEDPAKPGSFYFYESYKDQAALDSHMKSPHLAKAFAQVGDLVAGAPTITPLKVIAG